MSTTLKVDLRKIPKRSKTPIFAYCRKLKAEGVTEDTVLEVYRGETLAMRMPVWSGALLTVSEPESRKRAVYMNYAMWKKMPALEAA